MLVWNTDLLTVNSRMWTISGFDKYGNQIHSKNLCTVNGSTVMNADVISCTNFHNFPHTHVNFL